MKYQVDLDVFNGPMDLLLYLIAREEVDIQEVSISRIVDQYLEFMQQLKELDVEIGSDFLVMASTLILIKSKALLPKEEIDLEEEIDGQDELIQHLLEYKKIKMLSRALQEKADLHALRVSRPSQHGLPLEEPLSDEDLNLWDIIQAFSKIVKETGLDQNFSVIHSEKPISEYINTIIDKLLDKANLVFEDLFAGERTRSEAICNFISLLELARRRIIKVGFNDDACDLEVSLCWDEGELKSVKEDGIYNLAELFHDYEEELKSLDGIGMGTVATDETATETEAKTAEETAVTEPAFTEPDVPVESEPVASDSDASIIDEPAIMKSEEPLDSEPVATEKDEEPRIDDVSAEGGAV